MHYLRLRFKKSRLVVVFGSLDLEYDHFFVSAGIFIKYFFFQKSLKKSKAVRLVMIRFTRKILLLLHLMNLTLYVKGVPLFLENLILAFLSPLRHLYYNPLTNLLVNEVS